MHRISIQTGDQRIQMMSQDAAEYTPAQVLMPAILRSTSSICMNDISMYNCIENYKPNTCHSPHLSLYSPDPVTTFE
jgi:hypothetical protein